MAVVKTTAAEAVGLSPGFKFEPTDEMLVEHYLLPHLRGENLPFAGVVFVDDPRKLPPWALLDRHGKGGDRDRDREGAYFIAPAAAVAKDGRLARSVAGGGRWVNQKKREGEGTVVVGGEAFRWVKSSFSFHRDGDRRRGATGWVMHEVAFVPPPGSAVAATHRACHIFFTSHGQHRKRIPDGYDAAVKKEPLEKPLDHQEQSNQDQEQSNHQDQEQRIERDGSGEAVSR
uniref:NAC domain-containing protein n=1 Tax=Leersia perrieri TaxID=77586 RepID=A0A0D9VF11_9ORYZ